MLRALCDDSACEVMMEGSRQVGGVWGLEVEEGEVEGEGDPLGEDVVVVR